MSKPKTTITWRISATLLCYTLFTVLLLWAFQIMFLNKYYNIMQKTSIENAGGKIIASIARGSDDFESELEQICFSHGMCCLILDENEQELYSIDMMGRNCMIHSPAKYSMSGQLLKVLSGEEQEYVARLRDKHFKTEALVYAHAVTNQNGERMVVVLNAALEPLGSTSEILKSQLKIISAVLVICALLISNFAAKKLSQPIRKITEKAKRLAKGDYTADYDGGGIMETDELAETLNFSAQGLSKVEELRRELVANVSHDLKTPLTMIKAYAEMIRDLTGDDKVKRDEQLEVIVSEADRLTALVSDLIRISRDEDSERIFRSESFDIAEMISDICKRFASTNPDYKITVTGECKNAVVTADRESIAQVLYNFISNAINYTGENKSVSVLLEETDSEIKVSVKDSGKGISDEELPLIWERYYRSRNTHQRPVAGSGLGLSIVRGLLTKQNLRFGASSEQGAGSCFWFCLPKKTQ